MNRLAFPRSLCALSTAKPTVRISTTAHPFSTTKPKPAAKNRIFQPVRDTQTFQDVLLSSSSANRALITLWTASWCPSCKVVTPLIRQLIEEQGIGEVNVNTSVGFAEIELGSPEIAEVAQRYALTAVPTLLNFSRQEPQMETRITDANKLKNTAFLIEWIEKEAKRGGAGGSGGSLFGGFFGTR